MRSYVSWTRSSAAPRSPVRRTAVRRSRVALPRTKSSKSSPRVTIRPPRSSALLCRKTPSGVGWLHRSRELRTDMRVIGLMSGTSYDAIDAAAADLRLDGDQLVLTPLGMLSRPYGTELRAAVAASLPPASSSVEEVCKLDTRIGQAFADVARQAVVQL